MAFCAMFTLDSQKMLLNIGHRRNLRAVWTYLNGNIWQMWQFFKTYKANSHWPMSRSNEMEYWHQDTVINWFLSGVSLWMGQGHPHDFNWSHHLSLGIGPGITRKESVYISVWLLVARNIANKFSNYNKSQKLFINELIVLGMKNKRSHLG